MITEMFDGLMVDTPPRDLDALADLAERACSRHQNWLAIEVGSWVGRTAKHILRGASRHCLPGTLLCVDTFAGSPSDATGVIAANHPPGRVFELFCRNLKESLYREIFPLIGTSKQIGSNWPRDRKADLVFIDANHDYESVLEDIEIWYPKVKRGGILVGHDYGVFEGVTRAVDELLGPVIRAGACLWVKGC